MLKFIDVVDVVKEFLIANLSGTNIEQGKYGEMPSITPAVWIYIEPTKNQMSDYKNAPLLRRAKLTFFAMEDAAIDKTTAANKSIELIERVDNLISSDTFLNFLDAHSKNINANYTERFYTESEIPISFDSIYSDTAVSFLEIYINYAPFWQV